MIATRREFLRQSIGTGALVASGLSLPGFLARSATACAATSGRSDSILVVVQLTGGNDGLNTVIPFLDERYRKARPTLAIPSGQVLKLDDRLGFHPRMTALKGLYEDGLLAVVEDVGYPNPDRSHFRSMDIWHTAHLDPDQDRAGWLGKALDMETLSLSALHLDNGSLPLALAGGSSTPPSIQDIGAFRIHEAGEMMEAAIRDERPEASDDLLFIQRVTISSLEHARRLERLGQAGRGTVDYPAFPFGNRLRQIARLIEADFGSRIYYTSLGGFDTHSKQAPIHGQLLQVLSDGIAAFFKDLGRSALAERVILMTFSEFGRRVMENGSQGTDHGAAAPLFIAGPRCRAGIHGAAPDLEDLDMGDLKHRIDFRQVYAGILEDVLGCDPEPVLGRAFDPVRVIS